MTKEIFQINLLQKINGIVDALPQPVTTGFGFPQLFNWPATLFALSCLHLHFYLNFYHQAQQVFPFSKSYCRAAAVGEFMKFANGYPPQQGELILLNVTSVYPQ